MFISKEKLSIPNKNPLAVLEDETLEHVNKVNRMEIEMMEVLNKKVEDKIKKLDKVAKAQYKTIDDENKIVNELKVELQSRRDSFERHKSSFESLSLLSPSHSDNSTTSVGSTGKKKMFRFSFGSFKYKTNDPL